MTRERQFSRDIFLKNEGKSHWFYRQFFHQSNLAICISDSSMNIVFVNAKFVHLFGWSFEEMVENERHIVPANLYKENDLLYAKVLDGETIAHYETVRLHKNGNLLDVSITLWPLIDKNGKIRAIASVFKNISEKVELKKQLEALQNILQTSNKRHMELLESISDGFCAVNDQWNFTFLNNSLESIFKKSRHELLGKSLWSVFPIDSHQGIYKNLSKAMKDCKDVRFQEYSSTYNKYLQFNAYPSKEGLSIFTQDVTEQVRMIEALMESEERFHLLANNMSEIFWIASPTMKKWYYISPAVCYILGVSVEELENQLPEIIKCIDPRDYQKVKEACKQMRKRETIVEFRYHQPERPVQWIRLKGIPVFKDGILNVIVGIAEDVTQFIEREELLTKSEKLSTVGQLAAGIAHEIRNPLTSIKGFLQIIRSEGKVPSPYTKIMLDELERIESIVNEFLLLAKPQTEMKYDIQLIKPIVDQVIGLMQAEANLRAIEMEVDLTSIRSAYIKCNANHIKQAMINIIKNSIEAIQSNGKIIIEGEMNKPLSFVELRVIDNGPGISKDRLKKLGEPFYSTKEKGTGLGLMITRKLIEDHSGGLKFESEVGVGTVVRIQLPLITDETAQR